MLHLCRNTYIRLTVFALVSGYLLCMSPVASVEADEKDAEWTDLLADNKLTDNWHTAGNWKISDKGVVTLKPRPGEKGWSRFDAYLWSKKKYDDFEIQFDYMVQDRGNSGFYFRVGDKDSPVAKGIEVQIYDSARKGEDARLTDHDSGGIIPGIPPTENAAKPAGQWNRFHIIHRGDDLLVKLNGTVVNKVDLSNPKLSDRPRSGFIGFQDHALPLSLRNIRIREL